MSLVLAWQGTMVIMEAYEWARLTDARYKAFDQWIDALRAGNKSGAKRARRTYYTLTRKMQKCAAKQNESDAYHAKG